jgi:hypothetical protein
VSGLVPVLWRVNGDTRKLKILHLALSEEDGAGDEEAGDAGDVAPRV